MKSAPLSLKLRPAAGLRRLLTGFAGVAVLLAACGGEPAASVAPASVASAGGAAALASAPAASAKPAASGAASASAKPAASRPAGASAPTGSAAAKPAGSAAPAPASISPGVPAPSGSTKIRLGTLNNIGDEPLWAAKDKGYWADQSLDVQFFPFQSGSDELVALTTNQIDFAAGTPSAAYFNATDRGVPVKLIANLSVTNPQSKSVGISVRSDVMDSGHYKAPADLKGLKIAIGSAVGAGNISDMQWLRLSAKGGLTMKDLDFTLVPFPQMPQALANKAVDAAYLVEPFLSVAVEQQKTAKVIAYNGELNPGYPVYQLFVSPEFADKQRPTADRFMIGVARGMRYMSDAFVNKKNTDEALDILVNNQPLKDRAILTRLGGDVPSPDSPMDMKAYQDFVDIYTQQGNIKQKVDLNALVDPSFMKRAAQATK